MFLKVCWPQPVMQSHWINYLGHRQIYSHLDNSLLNKHILLDFVYSLPDSELQLFPLLWSKSPPGLCSHTGWELWQWHSRVWFLSIMLERVHCCCSKGYSYSSKNESSAATEACGAALALGSACTCPCLAQVVRYRAVSKLPCHIITWGSAYVWGQVTWSPTQRSQCHSVCFPQPLSAGQMMGWDASNTTALIYS